MNTSDGITLASAAITIISMVVSVSQARSAARSSQTAREALATVQLSTVAERLKSAQEHIRDVAPEKIVQRGFKIGSRIDLIRREFDTALSTLDKRGKGSKAREQLTYAQTKLNIYHSSINSTPDTVTWQELQSLVQDAISELTSQLIEIGKKNDK